VVAYAVAAGYTARRRRFDSDRAYARQYRARSEAQRRLHGVHDSSAPEQTLHDAVIQYIADQFNVNGAGMTAHDADRVLRERGCDGELCRNVQTILRKCERAVYASQTLPSEELNALAHGAAAAIDQIEAHGKKKK
jgi:hypothetical protein